MDVQSIKQRLESVCSINVTPFHPTSKSIEWNWLEENIEFLVKNGLDVIVPCGNTGEFYSLTLEEAKAVTKRVVEIVHGRAVVVAGIGYSLESAIDMGKFAQQVGADAVMIHQPIHPYVTDSGILAYYRGIIESLNIPSVVYFKDPNISDDVLKQMAVLKNFIGVKYAINDLPRFSKLISEFPKNANVAFICGTAEKWAPYFYFAGARGFTSGLVNVYPEKSFQLLRALQAGDAETMWAAWRDVIAFENLRAKYNNGNNVVVVKEAMNQAGLHGGVTREPVGPLDELDTTSVENILRTWGLLNKFNPA